MSTPRATTRPSVTFTWEKPGSFGLIFLSSFEAEEPLEPPTDINVAIVGVGLIGGSFGLALRRSGIARTITGFDISEAALEGALARKAIDVAAEDLEGAAAEADLIFIATPVSRVATVFLDLSPSIGQKTLVTDAGSSKAEIVRRIESSPRVSQFVGGHPFAGKETGGIGAAGAELFDGCVWFLTPTSRTDHSISKKVAAILETLGAKVLSISPSRHDELVAASSHLPQLVSTALAEFVRDVTPEDLPILAGTGLKDMTRLAASPSEMWIDVFGDNRLEILRLLERFGDQISSLRQAINDEDWDSVRKLMQDASSAAAEITGTSLPTETS